MYSVLQIFHHVYDSFTLQCLFILSQREIFFFLSIHLWVNTLRPKQIFLTLMAHIYKMCYLYIKEDVPGSAWTWLTVHLLPSGSAPGRTFFITFILLPILAPGCTLALVTGLYFRQEPDRKENIIGKCRVFYFSFMLKRAVTESFTCWEFNLQYKHWVSVALVHVIATL